MRYIYQGYAGIPSATLNGVVVGGELELDDNQLMDLIRRGHTFAPAAKPTPAPSKTEEKPKP